jgi:hypothetical protein
MPSVTYGGTAPASSTWGGMASAGQTNRGFQNAAQISNSQDALGRALEAKAATYGTGGPAVDVMPGQSTIDAIDVPGSAKTASQTDPSVVGYVGTGNVRGPAQTTNTQPTDIEKTFAPPPSNMKEDPYNPANQGRVPRQNNVGGMIAGAVPGVLGSILGGPVGGFLGALLGGMVRQEVSKQVGGTQTPTSGGTSSGSGSSYGGAGSKAVSSAYQPGGTFGATTQAAANNGILGGWNYL